MTLNTHEQFLDFCILCGCDYCPVVPKVGNVTAMKLIKTHGSIEKIIENTGTKYAYRMITYQCLMMLKEFQDIHK